MIVHHDCTAREEHFLCEGWSHAFGQRRIPCSTYGLILFDLEELGALHGFRERAELRSVRDDARMIRFCKSLLCGRLSGP